MLTEQEKKIIRKILEEDLRIYTTEEEWNEYIPKLINYLKWMPPKETTEPDRYINVHFTWKNSIEGDKYWRDWHLKVYNRIYCGNIETTEITEIPF